MESSGRAPRSQQCSRDWAGAPRLATFLGEQVRDLRDFLSLLASTLGAHPGLRREESSAGQGKLGQEQQTLSHSQSLHPTPPSDQKWPFARSLSSSRSGDGLSAPEPGGALLRCFQTSSAFLSTMSPALPDERRHARKMVSGCGHGD